MSIDLWTTTRSSDSSKNVPLGELDLKHLSDVVLFAYARDVGFISHQLNGYDAFIRDEVKRRLMLGETRAKRRGHESEMGNDDEDDADDEAFYEAMNPTSSLVSRQKRKPKKPKKATNDGEEEKGDEEEEEDEDEDEEEPRRKKRGPNLTGLYLRDEPDVYSYTKPRKTRAKLRIGGALGGMTRRDIAMMGETTTITTNSSSSTSSTSASSSALAVTSTGVINNPEPLHPTTTTSDSTTTSTSDSVKIATSAIPLRFSPPRCVSKYRIVPPNTLPTDPPIPFTRREDYEFSIRFTRVLATRHPEDFETEKPIRPRDARDGDAYQYDLTIEVDAIVEVWQHGVVKRAYEFKNGEIARIPVMVGSSYCTSKMKTEKNEEGGGEGEDPDDLGGYFIVNGQQKVLIAPERPLCHKIQRIVHDWNSVTRPIPSLAAAGSTTSTSASASSYFSANPTTTASSSVLKVKAFSYSVVIHSRTETGIPILTHLGVTNGNGGGGGENGGGGGTHAMMWVPATSRPILVPVPALLEACFETFSEDVPNSEDRERIRRDLKRGRHYRNALNAYESDCLYDPIGCVYRACCDPSDARERRRRSSKKKREEEEEEQAKMKMKARKAPNSHELEAVRAFLKSRFLSQCDLVDEITRNTGRKYNRIELLHHMIVELENLAMNPREEFDDPIDMANKTYATPTILLSELFGSLVKRATRMACELGGKYMQKRNRLDEAVEKMMGGLFTERRDEETVGGMWRSAATVAAMTAGSETTARRTVSAASRLTKHNSVTKGLASAFKTGNWTSMRRGGGGGGGESSSAAASSGVCQMLDETNTFSILAEARKLVSGEHRESKNTEKRQLHSSFFGYTCSNETPDGKKVGHIRTLGLLATISLDRTRSDNVRIHETLMRFVHAKSYVEMLAAAAESTTKTTTTNGPSYTPPSSQTVTAILLNGFVIGAVENDRMETFRMTLVDMRRRGELSFDVSFARRKRRMEIRTDAGRVVRPFYVVSYHENGKRTPTIPHVETNELMEGKHLTFPELVRRGVVEYMDAAESELAQIVLEHSEMDPSVVYTHCEIHPATQMGVSVACIPYSECNPSPRNTYYAGMCKQAIGAMRANHHTRFTTKTMVLSSPQKPIVSTQFSQLLGNFKPNVDGVVDLPRYLHPRDVNVDSMKLVDTPYGTRVRGGRVVEKRETGLDKYPIGANVYMLVGNFKNFNQEDSLAVCRDSIDRGLFRHVAYVTYECEFDDTHMYHSDVWNAESRRYDSRCETRITPARFAGFFYNPQTNVGGLGGIGSGGVITNFPDDAQEIRGGDVIVPRFEFNEDTTTVLDVSLCLPSREPTARVDGVRVFQSRKTGKRVVQVRLRTQHIPEIGDKFTSRYSQKGVASIQYPQQDLPFSASEGVTPDMVVNPNAIPSRMTIGHLRDMLEGKYGAIAGFDWRDATAFQNSFIRFNDEEEEEDTTMSMSAIERVIEGFEKAIRNSGTASQKQILHRWDGMERFYHPHTGLLIENTMFAGLCYYTRLKHLAAPKCYARATGPVDHLTRQPKHGRRYQGGIRFGEMERDCLVAHGAPRNLQDRTVVCSDPYTIWMCARCGSQPTEFTNGVPRCGACLRHRRIAVAPTTTTKRRPIRNSTFSESEAETAAKSIEAFLEAEEGEEKKEVKDAAAPIESDKMVSIRLRFAAKLTFHELIAMGLDVRLFVDPADAAIGMLEPENRKKANFDPKHPRRRKQYRGAKAPKAPKTPKPPKTPKTSKTTKPPKTQKTPKTLKKQNPKRVKKIVVTVKTVKNSKKRVKSNPETSKKMKKKKKKEETPKVEKPAEVTKKIVTRSVLRKR